MYRFLIKYVIAGMVLGLGAVWFANNPGHFSVEWLNHRIDTSLAFLATLSVLMVIVSLALYRLYAGVIGGPEAFLAYRREKKQRQGYAMLSKGMVAVAAGDAKEARKLAARAHALLDEPSLTLLLNAQAAQLEGHEADAEVAYRQMLASADTEFLGLRGLFMLAHRKDDRIAALDYAERAFALRPDTPWVFNALMELQSAQGRWDDAVDTLSRSVKSKLLPADVAKRRQSILYTEQALDLVARNDLEAAGACAEKALKLSPGLVPAVVIAARHLRAANKSWRAAELVEAAWSANPHPDLIEAYLGLKMDSDPRAQARWLKGLAGFNKNHFESRLLRARQHIALGQVKAAQHILEELIKRRPSARVFALMSDLEQVKASTSQPRNEEVRLWLSRAAEAPRDAFWVCDSCGREADAWGSVCQHCGGFDTLTWGSPDPVQLPPQDEAVVEEAAAEDAVEVVVRQEPAIIDHMARQEVPGPAASPPKTPANTREAITVLPEETEIVGESVVLLPEELEAGGLPKAGSDKNEPADVERRMEEETRSPRPFIPDDPGPEPDDYFEDSSLRK